jgi:predicted  nucleic acid-binding Zn-ribbon protein
MTASQKSESNRITDLVSWLRISAAGSLDPHVGQAADAIELLQRELKCSKEMWEQQQELALEYLADIEKANERIAELEREIDDYETTYKGSVVEAQAKRIAELEAMLKLSADFASKQQSLGKEFEKILFDNLDELYVVDPALEKGDE